jgi:CRISPR-associated Csx11 family protein
MSSTHPAGQAKHNAEDRLEKNAQAILFIELAALLHDIGKLNKGFLRYRQEWQGKKDMPDPHADKFLEKHETFKALIPKEFKNITLERYSTLFDEGDFSIQKAIDEHDEQDVMKVIKAADRNDSAIDRNNPLYSAEQKTGQIFRSNVFGNECGSPDRVVNMDRQDEYRMKLYKDIAPLLSDYLPLDYPPLDYPKKDHFTADQRRGILESVRSAFIHGLSDTCRPQNDTTLWDHSYAVASIAKVLTVHNLFCAEEDIIDDFQKVKYGIWGIGWDGLKFLSYGQKIGDITARKKIIEGIKNQIREIVEHQYPVGNTIYEDDNGIYFIVPANFTFVEEGGGDKQENQYGDLPGILQKEIAKVVWKESDCEIQPRFACKPNCTQLTDIVKVISSINKKSRFRFSSDIGFPEKLKGSVEFENGDEEVCSICRLRPTDRQKSQGEKKICEICHRRRREEAKTNRNEDGTKQTIFIDEIIDQHQRAALIVAKFDLDRWLDGKMLHTLFVTEARGIEKEIKTLNKIEQFKGEKEKQARENLQDIAYNYKRITTDIDAILNEEGNSEYVSFLYTHGRNFQKDKKNEKKRALETLIDNRCGPAPNPICKYNVINAKSPTPSTILDVWQTTRNFFKTSVINDIQEKSGMIRRNRVTLAGRAAVGGTFEAELIRNAQTERIEVLLTSGGNQADLIVSKDKLDSIKGILRKPEEAIIRITDKSWDNPDQSELKIQANTAKPYFRYRVITASPCLFMAIVPADQAVKISQDIYKQYQEQFGKVTGRLPFSVGNIFFRRRMPMFVVLDSARRMLNNFKRFSANKADFTVRKKPERKDGKFDIRVVPSENNDKEFSYHVPARLGNFKTDYYHAYALLHSGNNACDRKGFFKTIVGDVVPYSELEEGDKLHLYPNYYDFLYLDSNQKRHEIFRSADETDCYFMEELEQKFVRLWDNLITGEGLSGITQTKLKNLEALWLSKYQLWGGGNHPMFQKLVETSLDKEFIAMTDENKELMIETLKNGLFFRMMELQHTILKKRVRDDKEINNDKTV